MENFEAKARELIADKLGIDAAKITLNASFIEDLGADSLDSVELVMALEEEFGIEIPDDDAQAIGTLQQVLDYIAKAKLTKA